ncbi:hypothetical protein [Streptomyces sp. NPDC056468]
MVANQSGSYAPATTSFRPQVLPQREPVVLVPAGASLLLLGLGEVEVR